MRAGKLKHRLTIQKMTETVNTFGEPVATWSTFANIQGSIEPLRGRERWAAKEKEARIDLRIRIRYIAGINAKMRVLFGDHIYEITEIINPEMKNKEMQLMCYEVTHA